MLYNNYTWSITFKNCESHNCTSVTYIIFFCLFLINLFFILFFNFTILYWFCHISTWIRYIILSINYTSITKDWAYMRVMIWEWQECKHPLYLCLVVVLRHRAAWDEGCCNFGNLPQHLLCILCTLKLWYLQLMIAEPFLAKWVQD